MTRQKLLILAGVAALLLIAALGLNAHRHSEQSEAAGGVLFADLQGSLADVAEIRLSKGDGSRTTLRREPAGWTVVERQYPADGARVRELLLGLVGMKIVEHKTSDPANYAKLGVEPADSPTATSTLLEVVAGPKTWSLIIGKGSEGSAGYVRKPKEAVSELVEPKVSADPDQKRWVDRLIVDLPGADVHDISVKPATGPAYQLTRAKRGDADLTLSAVPKGRAVASAMTIDGQAESLAAFNFDDVRALPATAATATDRATYRTFAGEVFEFAGWRDSQKAYVTVNASHDAALAAQFAPAPGSPPAKAATAADRLAARSKGVEYEIPVYKYEAIFKPQEDLLEKKPAAAAPAPPKKAADGKKTLPTRKQAAQGEQSPAN